MADNYDSSELAIKKERAPSPPVITNTWDDSIELLSDDDEEYNTTLKATGPVSPRKSVSTGIDVDETREIGPSPEVLQQQLLAQQKKLADNFRNRAPQRAAAAARAPATTTPAAEAGEDDVAARYEIARKEYYGKKRNNNLQVEDEIKFMRMEGEYSAYQRKLAADQEYDNASDQSDDKSGSGLFVDTDNRPAPPLEISDAEDNATESRQKRGRKRGAPSGSDKPARKKTKKSTPADYSETKLDEVLAAARNKKKTPATKNKAQPRKKNLPINLTNTQSLYGADVFRDTMTNANLDSQPIFAKQGRRADAFKELVASVPLDSQKIAKVDKNHVDRAIKALNGRGAVSPAEGGNWMLKGMKTALKPYQLLGVSFMRDRENGSHLPRGGILADEMGLGKTIMMLANIINGKPPRDDKSNGVPNPDGKPNHSKCRTTLIVASPALVAQWNQEIRAHCQTTRENKNHGIGTVIQHRAGSRLTTNNLKAILEDADIVLTTYTEVSRSYPKQIYPPNLVTEAQKKEYWEQIWEEEAGTLHRIKFHRVVIDEASAIKNHKSHTSQSCVALEANHYWAISGTPVQNTLTEFYPYFKFLREPVAGSHELFKANFMKENDDVGRQRLHVILRKFMIRRTHLDTLFNARLLDLPLPHQSTIKVEFNDVERQIYELVRKRFIEKVNCMARNGQVHKKNIWTMLLRLRQITASVLLIFDSCLPLLEREDFEKLNTITSMEDEAAGEGVQLLLHLRNVIKEGRTSGSIEEGISGGVMTETDAVATGVVGFGISQVGETGGKHGSSYRFRKYLDKFRESEAWTEVKERSQCVGCRGQPDDPYVTSCSHIYCYTCLVDLQHLSARRGYDTAKCSECGETYTSSRPCEEGFEGLQPRPTSTSQQAVDLGISRGRGRKKTEPDIDWLGLKGDILPSAKTIAVKAQVLEWLAEKEDVKIIIYTQWIPMVKILARVCETEQWQYSTYTGSMSHDARANALEDFCTNPDKRILIGSLKCGGLGLNITAASRVILIDPWWNSAIEQQAFCRVFRIGQTQETKLTRLVVRNSIDEAMMAIKERKNIEIDEVMNSSKLHERLSVADLMRLFGNELWTDEDGQPFIYADDDGDRRQGILADAVAGEEGFVGDEP